MTTQRSRGWTALVPLLVVAAFVGLIALTTGPDDSNGNAPPAITVDDVAANPARYDGRQLVLSGAVADPPADVLDARPGAFILTARGDGRLLVTPAAGGRTHRAGSRVDVRGFVRTPDDGGGERADLLADARAAAVLDAVRIVEAD